MEKHKQSFECADAGEKSYTVHEYVQIINVGSFGNLNETIEGLGRLILDSDGSVNDRSDGTFLIVHSDTVIRAI